MYVQFGSPYLVFLPPHSFSVRFEDQSSPRVHCPKPPLHPTVLCCRPVPHQSLEPFAPLARIGLRQIFKCAPLTFRTRVRQIVVCECVGARAVRVENIQACVCACARFVSCACVCVCQCCCIKWNMPVLDCALPQQTPVNVRHLQSVVSLSPAAAEAVPIIRVTNNKTAVQVQPIGYRGANTCKTIPPSCCSIRIRPES